MSPSCSTSCLCSAKIGSQTLGTALWAGGSSWGITLLLANLAVRCLGALAHGMMQKAVGDKFYLNLFAHFTPWSLAHAFIKCYCPEMHLFCCLICQCSFCFVLFCFVLLFLFSCGLQGFSYCCWHWDWHIPHMDLYQSQPPLELLL